MANWGYNPYTWSYGPSLITGFWAHLVKFFVATLFKKIGFLKGGGDSPNLP